MKYQFPFINHIEQVLPHIAEAEEFTVAHRGEFTVINYQNLTSDTFRPLTGDKEVDMTSIIRRECRGITFYTTSGEICRRPFHKFFNAQEREETLLPNLDFGVNHTILEKLDGSLIAPVLNEDGNIIWGSKMISPEFHEMVDGFIFDNGHDAYKSFTYQAIEAGYTPLFEFCSRQNRVVVDHPEDRLVLTGMRHMLTGTYLPYNQFSEWGRDFGLDIVKKRLDSQEPNTLISVVRNFGPEEEGVVVDFVDGHKVKIKGDTYTAIHKTKDDLLYERNVIALILDEKVDDILPFMIEYDRERLVNYQDEFSKNFGVSASLKCTQAYIDVIGGMNRKTWALERASEYGSFASVVFKNFEALARGDFTIEMWRNVFYNGCVEVLRNALTSNIRLEEFKRKNNFDWKW